MNHFFAFGLAAPLLLAALPACTEIEPRSPPPKPVKTYPKEDLPLLVDGEIDRVFGDHPDKIPARESLLGRLNAWVNQPDLVLAIVRLQIREIPIPRGRSRLEAMLYYVPLRSFGTLGQPVLTTQWDPRERVWR